MRPEKLIICGWGPYKEETVIDFSKLNSSNLFLITGQTGAGKTTIFDAIAYALYGMMSGDIREKGSVRSDFADADTKTYVELFMTHKGERYHIYRNPEYMRPKKKKNGENSFTKEKENAAITLPDGTIIAGNQDVTKKVEDLLRMDGRQFCQISMIAQGEFAKLLYASQQDKTRIFRELFGTGVYAAVQSGLKERSAKLYREYMMFKNKMDEDIHLLSLEEEKWKELVSHASVDFEAAEEYLSDFMKSLNSKIRQKEKEEKRMQEDLLLQKEKQTKIRQINETFELLHTNQEKLRSLQEKQTDYEELAVTIDKLKKIQFLIIEERRAAEKAEAVLTMEKRLTGYDSELEADQEKADRFASLAAKKECIRETFERNRQLQETRKNLQIKEKETKREEKYLEEARTVYVRIQEYAQKKGKQYEEADKLYKNAVIGIAARMVKEGEPCPVCGAIEHPKVAPVSDQIPDEKRLEVLKREADAARKEENKQFGQTLSYQKNHEALQKECQILQKKIEEYQQIQQKIPSDIKEYTDCFSPDVFEKELMEYVEIQSRMEEKKKQIAEVRKDLDNRKTESDKANKYLQEQKCIHGFGDETEYQQLKRQTEDLDVLEKDYRSYQESLVSLQKLCDHLKESLAGKSKTDENEISQVIGHKQKQLADIRESVRKLHVMSAQVGRSLNGIRENRAEAEQLRKEYGIVKDLDDIANGNNPKRLVFEQYVLAGYFEQILKAANQRLLKMTEGRYELIRAKQISDGRKKDNLEILVMDYYTGKERSVKTLSGGESFKASLSLALGLSDCIQAENGGLEIETLFIDEGFGALDEESLQQACEVLHSLAGSKRMIGIISHVQQLREKIDQQLIIEKKNFGSSIRMTEGYGI